jgi:hypothetical protein
VRQPEWKARRVSPWPVTKVKHSDKSVPPCIVVVWGLVAIPTIVSHAFPLANGHQATSTCLSWSVLYLLYNRPTSRESRGALALFPARLLRGANLVTLISRALSKWTLTLSPFILTYHISDGHNIAHLPAPWAYPTTASSSSSSSPPALL